MNNRTKAKSIAAATLVLMSSHLLLAATTRKVTPDGHGDFITIQAAIDSVPLRNSEPVIIEIAPGRYREQVIIPKNKPFITLRGMGNVPADVWIGGTIEQTGAILTANAPDFLCEHLTLDDQSPANDGQARSAIALGAVRQAVEDCEIKGKHNTVSIRGGTEAYLHCCSITGTGDIVYGAGTAYFDTCDVLVVEPAGTIATPSTPKEVAVGFVFVDCRLVGSSSAKPLLMRPWTADGATVFIRCSMDKYMSRQGWSPWDGREMTCRAEEFGSISTEEQPLELSKRPAWVHRLSANQAARYTLANVYPEWSPHPHISN